MKRMKHWGNLHIILKGPVIKSFIFILAGFVLTSGCADLVFVSERDGHPQIYKMSGEGKSQINISQNQFVDEFPDVSPDGKKVVFSSSRNSPGKNIYIMNIDGSNVNQITSGDLLKTNPRWSPSHDLIAFAEYIPVNKAKIFCVNSDGTGLPVQITNPTSLQSDSGGLAFFDYGNKIIFSRYDLGKGNHDLYYKSVTIGGNPIAITSTVEANETLPAVSHDGKILAFLVFKTMQLATTGKITLDYIQILDVGTWTPINTIMLKHPASVGSISAIAFSHNDERLYVAAKTFDVNETLENHYEIFSIKLDGSEQKRLTKNKISDYWPNSHHHRWITMTASPVLVKRGDITIGNPGFLKQGDIIDVKIEVGDDYNLKRVNYRINDLAGTITSISSAIRYDTCKNTGKYFTSLSLWGEAIYRDGEIQQFNKNYDLTMGHYSREDSDRTYAFYVAEDSEGLKERNICRANAFIDNFDSYSESQYCFAEPGFYTNTALSYANSVDMTLSIGHGGHHLYYAGNTGIDLSTTEFGNLSPCKSTGDLEYLAFISCQTLSIADYGGHTFWYYWLHDNETKLGARPFTGLHMVLGFRTNVVFNHSTFDDDGEGFLSSFARNLDDGMRVREAWLEAGDDELSFNDGNNRAAVIYLEKYENDRLAYDERNDYIYGNTNYSRVWIEYY